MKQKWVIRQPAMFAPLIALVFLISSFELVGQEAPGDLVFEREDESQIGAFPPSIFQHWLHRVRYRCDACHDDLFKMELGANDVTMKLINEGKACGACHDGTTAFSTAFENCSRCHRKFAD